MPSFVAMSSQIGAPLKHQPCSMSELADKDAFLGVGTVLMLRDDQVSLERLCVITHQISLHVHFDKCAIQTLWMMGGS